MASPRRAGRFSAAVAAALLGLLCLSSALAAVPEGAAFPWAAVRLPTAVVPLHYQLLIQPNLTTLTFAGTAAIEVLAAQQSSAVVLHSKGLKIVGAALVEAGGAAGQPLRVLQEPRREQLALLAARPLRPGRRYTLRIRYSAPLSRSFHGFYRSTYRSREGELR